MNNKGQCFDWDPSGFGGESGHTIGDPECPACWKDSAYKCKHCETGLVHTEFGDENYDGDYWLYSKCDQCGEM